jgi:hypothetical protein
LDDFEFNRILLVQGFVSLTYDCSVMNKYIRTVIASDETMAFAIVEPFDLALHLPSSLGPNGFALLPGCRMEPFTAWRTKLRVSSLTLAGLVQAVQVSIKTVF